MSLKLGDPELYSELGICSSATTLDARTFRDSISPTALLLCPPINRLHPLLPDFHGVFLACAL